MADAADTRALLLTIQANTELLRSNLSQAERAVKEFTDQTQQHLDHSDARFEAFGKSLEKLERPLERLKSIGEGAFAFLLGESLVEKGKQALEFAGNIEFAAQKIGVSTTFLQQFRYAASQSGADIEVADAALTKFTRSVGEAANGNKKIIKLFNDLKVEVLDSAGKVRSVESVYLDASTAISKIDNPAQRAADTLTLMGRGASNIIPLMAKGAAGFNELAAAAEQLGVVLSPELIEHSEQVNHQLAALKLIMDAQMASAVAQNAQSIGSLASEIISLTSALLKFQSAHPEVAFALIGAAAGSRFGIYGAAAGGIGGTYVGGQLGKQADDANPDLTFRRQQLADARKRYDNLTAHLNPELLGKDPASNAAAAELRHQFELIKAAIAQAKSPHGPENPEGLGSTGAGASNPDISHHKSAEQLAREAEAARQKKLAEDEAFEGELRQAQEAYQKAEASLADTAQAQLSAELESLQDALITRVDQVKDRVSAGKISEARGQQLITLYEQAEDDQEQLAKRKEIARLVDEAGARAQLDIKGQEDLLQLDDRLATTRKDRLKIELKLLALQEQAAIRAQQDIIDKSQPGSEAAKNAQTTINQINAQHGRNVQSVKDQNQDPLQAYSKQLHAATDDMNDALKSVEVDGLQSLQEGLLGVISGTESVGSAFKKMALSIIADLAKIAIEKAIVSAIGSIGIPGLSNGGPTGASTPGFAYGGLPRYDGGGKIVGPGTGRSDSIIAILGGNRPIRVSNGEFIMNAQATHDNLGLLEALNSGRMPKYADGGLPSAPRMPRSMNGWGGGGVTIQLATNVQMVGTTSDDVQAMRAEMRRRDAALPGQIITTVADARSRRILR